MLRPNLGASLVASVLLAACGRQTAPTPTSPSPTTPSPTPSPTVTAVTITGAAPAMGAAAEFTATAKFSDNTMQDVSAQAAWESSNTAVLTVSTHGVVTAVGIGEVDIRAMYQNVTGLEHVSVVAPPAPSPPPTPGPTPPPDPANCGILTISPTSQNFGENGPAPGTISVTTPADCAWTAASRVSWVTITGGARGIGNGSVSYSVAANLDTVGRSGTILIGSRAFTVTQDARPPCPATVSPTTFTVDGRTLGNFPVSSGPPLSITVTMSGACSWAPTTDAPSWLLIDSGGSGSGTLTVRVFQNNSGAARTGRITVAGQTVSVTQTACTFSLTPSSATVGPSATNVSFTAQGSPGCLYNFNRSTDFLSVPFQSIGYGGTNTVSIGVPQNPGTSQRAETLKMEGRESDGLRTLVATATITQLGE